MLTQRRWRIGGAILLALSGGMAFLGVRIPYLRESPVAFIAYWVVFLAAFVGAIYCAILDFHYIRVQMALAERELFRQMLGDEALRKALRKGRDEREN